MFLGMLLFCELGATTPDIYTCWTLTSPYLYETEEQCQLAIHGFLGSSQGILTLLEGNVEEVVCFQFNTGADQGV